GGGGGPGPVKTPIVPPATPPSIKFVKMPVLVEVRPGATVMESILIEGFGEDNATELAVEVSGVPADWVSVTPSAISLSPGHPEALNAVIAVPLGAWPGDYVVTVTLAGEIRAESFFILRIKSYPSGYEKPSITRAVAIDRTESITRISIRVENSGRFIELLEVTDNVPKTLAPTADSITSISPEAEIVEHDPVLKWRLRDLDPYETRMISYEVSRVLDEYSPYVYWPVGQVNMFYTTKKALAEPIRIQEMSAPTLSPGKAGDVSVTLMNFETGPVDMSARFELPGGWQVEPDRITDVFPPRTEITFVFSVTPPPDTEPGTYIVTFRIFYNDGRESSKDGTLFVTQTLWGEISGYPGALLKRSLGLFVGAIAIIFAVLAALLYLKRKRKKRYKREAVSAVRSIKEKIGLE
ncbi:MAG: NEW3 domain-containing protein, partial [Candidatus Hydrothermarchaeaceae archaeon]